MQTHARLLIGLSLAAAVGACAGRNLPPEPDTYVAADAIGADRAADLAASPAATWLDDLNSIEMSALAREALAGSPDLQIVEARYRAARWRARMAQQRGGTYTQRDAASDLGMALSSYQDQERGTNRVTGEPIRTPRSLLRACAAIEHGIDPIE